MMTADTLACVLLASRIVRPFIDFAVASAWALATRVVAFAAETAAALTARLLDA